MDGTRVLVGYATKRGSTAGLAEAIRDRLRGDGLNADATPISQVRSLGPYDAVLVGSAVYANRWRRPAVRFLRKHRAELSSLPVWLFQSGPLDDSADRRKIPLPEKVAGLATEIGSHEHVTFGGKLDERSRGRIAKKMVQGGRGGDFRNFARVDVFAEGVAAELRARSG